MTTKFNGAKLSEAGGLKFLIQLEVKGKRGRRLSDNKGIAIERQKGKVRIEKHMAHDRRMSWFLHAISIVSAALATAYFFLV